MKLNNVIFLFLFYSLAGSTIKDRLEQAGKNKNEIQNAIAKVSKAQSAGMEWLIMHMPSKDLTIINSKFLTPLNKSWYKLGIFLGTIMSPIVMGIIFFTVLTPIGFILRLMGKDLLKLKKKENIKTYWIKKIDYKTSMKKQF